MKPVVKRLLRAFRGQRRILDRHGVTRQREAEIRRGIRSWRRQTIKLVEDLV